MLAIELYRKAADLTSRMADAARLHDWDKLTMLGASREALLASAPPRLLPASTAENLELQELIRTMLSLHEEIDTHAGPWLEHTANFLSALDQSKPTVAP